MAKQKLYFATDTIGGGTGALDGIDGSILNDKDVAIVFDAGGGVVYMHYLDDDSAAAESDPDVIAPDVNAGDKRWIKLDLTAETLTDLGVSAFMQTVLDDAAATNALTTLGFSTYIKTLIDDTTAATARTTLGVYAHNSTKFTWSDTDTITLRPARYYHAGTTAQTVYWDSDLTFDFGSGGSNADSTDLAADTWYGVYVDDSAVVAGGTNVITAARLVNSDTLPSWSDSKHGWYNGNDLCIGVFKTDAAAAELIEFYHVTPEEITWADHIEVQASANRTTSWVDATALLLPSCCTQAQLLFTANYASSDANTFYWRTKGATGTVGHIIAYVSSAVQIQYAERWVEAGSGANHPYIQVRDSSSSAATLGIYQQGYKLPIGMF